MASAGLVAVLALSPVGCGEGGNDSLSSEVAVGLQGQVAAARQAAAAADLDGARLRLGELRAAVDGHRAEGRLGDDRAERILAAVAEVEAALAAAVPATTVPAVPTTTDTEEPPPDEAPVEGLEEELRQDAEELERELREQLGDPPGQGGVRPGNGNDPGDGDGQGQDDDD